MLDLKSMDTVGIKPPSKSNHFFLLLFFFFGFCFATVFSAITGRYSVEKRNSSVLNVKCFSQIALLCLKYCKYLVLVFLSFYLLCCLLFIFNWAEAPLDIHIPSRSHWELPGRIKLPVLAAARSCPVQTIKGGVV